jgi:hypothetical protein
VTDGPKKGYVYLCRAQNTSNAGAFKDGPWINETSKIWDLTKKISVTGSVNWPTAKFTINTDGTNRTITSNGLPYHTTGIYPILSTDAAYQYDRNPNSIKTQTFTFTLPENPTLLSSPECVGGEVGITLSGIPIFNGFDEGGRDAVAHEVQDHCEGHPQVSGQYHYHGYSDCLKDNSKSGEHSDLVAYAFDGFGIYGLKGENGEELSSADLDECHGHTHAVMWNGKMQTVYHYHFTRDFPYSVACFRGKKMVNGPIGGTTGQMGQGRGSQGGMQQGGQMGGQGMGSSGQQGMGGPPDMMGGSPPPFGGPPMSQ